MISAGAGTIVARIIDERRRAGKIHRLQTSTMPIAARMRRSALVPLLAKTSVGQPVSLLLCPQRRSDHYIPTMFAILALLGGFCLFVGFIVFIIGGFRVSVLWGLTVLFLPGLLTFGASILGAMLELTNLSWWLGVVLLIFFLPWVVFISMHWEKAKNGILLYVAGIGFFVAAGVSIAPKEKEQIAAVMVAKSGQALPPAVADWLGVKPAASTDKPGTAGGAGAKPGRPAPPGGPGGKPGGGAQARPRAGGVGTEGQGLPGRRAPPQRGARVGGGPADLADSAAL